MTDSKIALEDLEKIIIKNLARGIKCLRNHKSAWDCKAANCKAMLDIQLRGEIHTVYQETYSPNPQTMISVCSRKITDPFLSISYEYYHNIPVARFDISKEKNSPVCMLDPFFMAPIQRTKVKQFRYLGRDPTMLIIKYQKGKYEHSITLVDDPDACKKYFY